MYIGMPTQRHQRGHALLSIAVLLMVLSSVFMTAVSPKRTIAVGASQVIDLSNAARIQNGLPAFIYNQQLATAAQLKAEHMRANNYFEHTAPDGTTGWYFIGTQGYQYITAGENLAATNEDAAAVVNGWMNSPGHRANILNSAFSEVGYGVVFVNSYLEYSNIYFVVALYGQPVPPVAPQATPTTPQTSAVNTQEPPPTIEQLETVDSNVDVPESITAEEQLTEPVPVVGSISSPPGTTGTPSGTLNVIEQSRYAITPFIAGIALFVAIVMMIIGIAIELRHIFHTPRLHHHRLKPQH